MDVFSLTMRLKEEGAAQVKASVDKLNKSFDDASNKAKLYDSAIGSLKNAFAGLAAGFAIDAVIGKVIAETSEAEFAAAQLNATLKSTKGVAGQSAEALNAHAAALSQLSIFDDDVITGAQSLLLTFTKIQGDTFPKATEAVLNVATAMGTDLKSAAIQVGKALNDPIQGVSALARSGIQFTDSQKLLIEELVNTNKLMDAQKIILAELETQFGGSAKAARDTFGGALRGLANDIGNALTLTGDGVSIATKAVQYLSTVVKGLRQFFDQVILLGEMAYVNVAGVFRIMKAMESPSTYVEAYRQITGEMAASREKFRAAYRDAVDVSAMSKEAADYITKMGNSTTVTAGAFGFFGDSVLKTDKAFRQFEVTKDDATKKGKTYMEMLVDLTGLLPITTTEQKKLVAEEQRLAAELGKANVSMANRLKLAQQLHSVQEALSKATIKYTLDEAAARLKAQAGTFGAGPTKRGFEVAGIDPERVRATAPGIKATFDAVRAQTDAEVNKTATELRDSLYNVLGDALLTGIEAAFQKGANFGSAMKAFGAALLAGLGSVMVAFGQRLVQLGVALKTAMDSFRSGNGFAMIAAGLAIIAIGSALRGAAGRAMDSSGFGGGGGGYTAPAVGGMTGGSMGIPTQFYWPTAAGSASTIERVNPVNVTIIGPNDPAAQRQMQELVRNAQRRGSV